MTSALAGSHLLKVNKSTKLGDYVDNGNESNSEIFAEIIFAWPGEEDTSCWREYRIFRQLLPLNSTTRYPTGRNDNEQTLIRSNPSPNTATLHNFIH